MDVNDIQERIVVAFEDNYEEMIVARKNGDVKAELLCKGYDTALRFVLSLYGISCERIVACEKYAQRIKNRLRK